MPGLPAKRGLSHAAHSTMAGSFSKVQDWHAQRPRDSCPTLASSSRLEFRGVLQPRGRSHLTHSTERPLFWVKQEVQCQGGLWGERLRQVDSDGGCKVDESVVTTGRLKENGAIWLGLAGHMKNQRLILTTRKGIRWFQMCI